jgi:hypothetical protein
LRDDKGPVDISIDFKWADHNVVEAMADVAYESGEVLSTLPIQSIPLKGNGSIVESAVHEVATRISEYLQQQRELIGRALLAQQEGCCGDK